MEDRLHTYECFMCYPLDYMCRYFRHVISIPDLSKFICKDYMHMIIWDYRGIDQHQFCGANSYGIGSHKWEEVDPNSLESTRVCQKLLIYVMQKLL